jgi:hypothetical protein
MDSTEHTGIGGARARHRIIARRLLERLQTASLHAAAREQKLAELSRRLANIVPDLLDQYTTFTPDSEMVQVKLQYLHSFQVALALGAIRLVLDEAAAVDRPFRVVDIGDSSGTHTLYLKSLLDQEPRLTSRSSDWISVNLDPVAVDKIRAKGLRAELTRAEDLNYVTDLDIDLFMSFEMLEHLSDPVSFLGALAQRGGCEWLALTVPYLRQSRVGLHHIRHRQNRIVYPENTHILELSPEDWRLLFQHSGWKVASERIYRQYPRWGLWRAMQPLWRKLDFEGFYGAILRRDSTWSERYQEASPEPTPRS